MRALPLPPSLYAETACQPPETLPLDGNRSVSVAVIGGGFTGLSAAPHLAERGVDVTVLEAHQPGWDVSGRNVGRSIPRLDQVIQDFGSDLGGRMMARSGNGPKPRVPIDPASPDGVPGATMSRCVTVCSSESLHVISEARWDGTDPLKVHLVEREFCLRQRSISQQKERAERPSTPRVSSAYSRAELTEEKREVMEAVIAVVKWLTAAR